MFTPDISLLQALDIWSELEQAYHGTNPYGGDTAEIYACRLVVAHVHHSETEKEVALDASRNLHALLWWFARKRHADVMINVGRDHDGEPLSDALLTQLITHRIHVRVKPRTRD
jgi:hypothetical protein